MCSCLPSILYLPRWRSSKRKTQMELLDLPILGTPSVRGFGNANPGGANGHESQLHGADSSGFLVVRGCKGKHGMHMLQLGHSRSSTMFHMFFSNSLCPGLLSKTWREKPDVEPLDPHKAAPFRVPRLRFKFPQIKPHPWHKVFRSRTSQEARVRAAIWVEFTFLPAKSQNFPA